MTAQKLYTTLKFLDDLERKVGSQKALELVRDSLSNIVSNPAAPPHQSALANALSNLDSSAAKLGESVTPSQAQLLAGMGGAEFFDPTVAEKVRSSVAANAMTPTVARDFVQDLASRRAKYLATVSNTLRGLGELKITAAKMQPGSADMAFQIPRDLFDNELGPFAKELSFINSLIGHVTEARTGQFEPVQLEELSSSEPSVVLAAAAIVVGAIAEVVNKFLDGWKKIEEIREIRQRLAKTGMKGTALDELTGEIERTVEEVVEESTTTILLDYKGDGGRKHELSNALANDMRRLFGQIERGLTVEFRAEPNEKEEDETNRKALEAVSALSRKLTFPGASNEPLLLTNGEVVEGPEGGTKIFKKTTSHKSTKKETHSRTKPDTKQV
jgi:hypothetical protein